LQRFYSEFFARYAGILGRYCVEFSLLSDSAASDLYCMLMAEFLVAAKGTLRARFGNWQRY
jgi:hypothetical protein